MPRSAEDAAAVAELQARNAAMHSEASIRYGREFAPRASDVFVATYPKCGTTWVQAILHALRGGSQDFEEITQVAPWDVVAFDCGQDLTAEQEGAFRVFKSHEGWPAIAKGAKYVYVVRRPDDAFLSFYNFLPQYCHVGALSVETFAEAIFDGMSHSGGMWKHFSGWLDAAVTEPETVLVISFEALKSNLKREIDRIARFVGVDEAVVEDVRQVTTFEYMSSRRSQFDDHFQFHKLKRQMGLPADAEHLATKIQAKGGKVGKGKELPASVLRILSDNWNHSDLLHKHRCATYDDLLRLVADLQRRHHPSALDDDDPPSSS